MIWNNAADVQAGMVPADYVYAGSFLVWQRMFYDETKYSIIRLDASGNPVSVEIAFPFEAGAACKSYLNYCQTNYPDNRYYLHIGSQMGLTEIPYELVRDCDNLVSVTVPPGVTSIAESAFNDCENLTVVRLPESLRTIGQNAFSLCPLSADFVIPNGVTTIGNAAFGHTNLISIVIPDSVTMIEKNAFRNCEYLQSITIPAGVAAIYSDTFGNCSSLASVTISDGVEHIYDAAFGYCTALQSIEIPASITSIVSFGNIASFYHCDALTNIIVNKPQDSIRGAPWGAANATVIWTG